MSKKKSETATDTVFINANRRGFLQGAAVASGVAATGVAVAVEQVGTHSDPVAQMSSGHKGYELNDYVRQYYKRARS